ncbi:restriction endonuclease [Christiangramia sp. LLG6405-1]|uniref:restriction endonuclease n=1 Tax=Christiangramia sp. LLG6405-1 TaxID=3160832 RepID=UPI0038677FAE
MFDLPTYQALLANVDAAATNNEKGERFEELCQYLLSELDGVKVEGRDAVMNAEEIDIVLWNAQSEEVLKPFENIILVECKNWSVAVGAPALDSFISKLRRRTMKTGIFIAANGVTGDFLNGNSNNGAIEIIKAALQEGIRVIILNRADLDAINSLNDLRTLIRKRYCGLFIHKLFNN